MSERGNEFELWPSRFSGDDKTRPAASLLTGWPPSTFQVAETRLEIHRRLGQIHSPRPRGQDSESEDKQEISASIGSASGSAQGDPYSVTGTERDQEALAMLEFMVYTGA